MNRVVGVYLASLLAGAVVFGELAYSHPQLIATNHALALVIHPIVIGVAAAFAGLALTVVRPNATAQERLARAVATVLLTITAAATVLALVALAISDRTLRAQLLAPAVAVASSWFLVAVLALIWTPEREAQAEP